MRIAHTVYAGARPKLDAHVLSAAGAQVASNCQLGGGGLRPFRAPLRIAPIDLTSCQTLFRASFNGQSYFLTAAEALDFVLTPIPNDPYERLFYTGMTEARFLANDTVSDPPDLAADFIKLGIPSPTAAHVLGSSGGGTTWMAYFYRFLNRYDDYGSNSPPVTLSTYDSGRVTHSGIESAPADRAIDRIELFKVNASDKDTVEYQFVLEARYFTDTRAFATGEYCVYDGALHECTTAHAAGAWNAANFTAGEAVPDDRLGNVCDSTDYYPPPAGLRGLAALANGALAGVAGNMVCFSEPGRPWAWPTAYRKVIMQSDAAGLGVFGTNVAVATAGAPAVIYGQHPDSMTTLELTDFFVCGYPRTIDTWRDQVYFRSPQGMARVGADGAFNATELTAMIDAEQWPAYAPLHGVFFNDRYFGFHGSGGVIFDFATGEIVTTHIRARACCVADDGELYFVAEDEAAINPAEPPEQMPLCIKRWAADPVNYLYYTWRGRLELLDYDTQPVAGALVLDRTFYDAIAAQMDIGALNATIFAGDIGGALGDGLLGEYVLGGDDLFSIEGFAVSTSVSYKVYLNGALLCERVLADPVNLFTIKGGRIGREIEIEIAGFVPVRRDAIATSTKELMGYVND
jgi:hypothetical protein